MITIDQLQQELRYGNYIFDGEQYVKFKYLDRRTYKIYTQYGWGIYEDDVNYFIPLTPEILEKAGFELDGIGHRIRLHDRFNKYRSLSLAYNNDDAIPKYYTYYRQYNSGNPNDRCEDNIVQVRHDLQYLHQLQNLYFSLTQTELNIQL